MDIDDAVGVGWGIYLIFGIILIGIVVVGSIGIDIHMDEHYQGYYYLAHDAGSPEVVASFLEQYLEAVEDIHGYSGIVYRNPRTDVDHQKQVVRSFLDRANDLSSQKELQKQSIDVQLSFQKLTDDMMFKQLQLVRWSWVNERGGIMGYFAFFVSVIWWWTLIVWYVVKEEFF